MLTRLDAVLFCACLASGAMALENQRHVDIGAPDRVAEAKPICRVEFGPPPDRPGFSQIAMETPIPDLIIRCEPPT